MKKLTYYLISLLLLTGLNACYYDGDLGRDGDNVGVPTLPNFQLAGEYLGIENCDGAEFEFILSIASFTEDEVIVDNIFDSGIRIIAQVSEGNVVSATESVDLAHEFEEGEETVVTITDFVFTRDADGGPDDQISFNFTILDRSDGSSVSCSFNGVRRTGFE